jgi:tryptophanase
MRVSHDFPLAYMIEDTATQYTLGSSKAMKELCAKIGFPVVLDAANVASYAHRLRNYWTNL